MKTYLTKCTKCGRTTSRAYARQHSGQCKTCSEGVSGARQYKCPDCGGPISKHNLDVGYHCGACTREADPAGYAAEVRGHFDYPD